MSGYLRVELSWALLILAFAALLLLGCRVSGGEDRVPAAVPRGVVPTVSVPTVSVPTVSVPAAVPTEVVARVGGSGEAPGVVDAPASATPSGPEPTAVVRGVAPGPVEGPLVEPGPTARVIKPTPPGLVIVGPPTLPGPTVVPTAAAAAVMDRELSRESRHEGGAGGAVLPVRPAGGFPPEAGGLVNPNDALLPLVYFEGYGVNPFVDADEDPLSTFSLDGDTASYEVALLYLVQGALPPPDSVRVEEWVNAQATGYPDVGSGLGLFIDGGPSPFGEDGYRMVRVGVRAASLPGSREPVSLVLVLDVSGSMRGDGRIDVAKRVILGLLDLLRADDRVALVTYGSTVEVVQGFTSGTEVGGLRSVVSEIWPGGSTHVEGGIRRAYELAGSEAGRNVRIVVLSDGVGNLGVTGPDSILKLVDENAQRRAVLTTVGVGMSGNYNDVMLEVLANRGNGTYHYVGDREAAEEFLSERATGVFVEVARDARIQVEFNPEVVRKYRLLGYENRAVADEDFRKDDLDFGELGFARDVTALYEVRLFDQPAADGVLLTAYLRWRDVASGNVLEVSEGLEVGSSRGTRRG